MNRSQQALALAFIPLVLSGCFGGSEKTIETSCAPVNNVTPICGVQMPEDLAVLPGEGGLIVSEYGDMGHMPGYLTWYQPGPGAEFVRLADSSNITQGSADTWGEPDCPVPDKLSPHGIQLSERDNALQLLVVNHSSLEQVLFYEVLPSTDVSQPPALAWRGCVSFPDYAVLNDVAALPDGGFVVTHMYDRENESLASLKSFLGLNKGHVWRWSPGKGSRVVKNSVARMPNGIETDPSGESFWVNNYIEGEVRQYSVATEEILAVAKVPNIDNSAWLDDGRLAVASHMSPFSMTDCFGLTKGSCGHGYAIVAFDPKNPEVTETIFSHPGGGPFGPATVAVSYKGKLYAGSFSGDRMAEITLTKND